MSQAVKDVDLRNKSAKIALEIQAEVLEAIKSGRNWQIIVSGNKSASDVSIRSEHIASRKISQ